MVKKVRTTKADKIWAYKVKHPEASAKEIAKATKSSAAYVWKLMEKIGTPKEVLEAPKNVVMTEHMDLTQKIAEKYTL